VKFEVASISTKEEKMHMRCRVCGGAIYPEALLQYSNMPATAQGFPTLETLAQDHGANLEVCQCSACGLIQLSNEPVPYYRDVIRAAAFSEDMRVFRVAQFKAWADKYQLFGRKILEVGCGRGEYLSLLNDVGVDAYGLEHATASVQDCRDQGLRVSQGYLGDDGTPIEIAPFDGFVCLNFMEHWPKPTSSLQAIGNHLTDGAIGLVEVPNFDMIVEKGLFSEFIADHLLYFTEDTMRLTLQSNGFDVLECQRIWQDYILSAVVRKRAPTNLTFFDRFRTDISSQLNHYINRFPSQKVAVWGAGHQSLAVIALADLANKIAYVIDSAPFKQGKYTPATHLPIVAADYLKTNPVEAIIVMAASYSDEVARLIRTRYGYGMKVAILRDNGLEEI
jgi:SAM-dependent methyltransferase